MVLFWTNKTLHLKKSALVLFKLEEIQCFIWNLNTSLRHKGSFVTFVVLIFRKDMHAGQSSVAIEVPLRLWNGKPDILSEENDPMWWYA